LHQTQTDEKTNKNEVTFEEIHDDFVVEEKTIANQHDLAEEETISNQHDVVEEETISNQKDKSLDTGHNEDDDMVLQQQIQSGEKPKKNGVAFEEMHDDFVVEEESISTDKNDTNNKQPTLLLKSSNIS
jgi:hypothetical protein